MTDMRLKAAWPARPVFVVIALILHVIVAAAVILGLLAGLTAHHTQAAPEGPRLTFEARTHDFGQISSSQPMDYGFAFSNTGTAPLEISEVRVDPPGPGG